VILGVTFEETPKRVQGESARAADRQTEHLRQALKLKVEQRPVDLPAVVGVRPGRRRGEQVRPAGGAAAASSAGRTARSRPTSFSAAHRRGRIEAITGDAEE
jgi:hypothetical protein